LILLSAFILAASFFILVLHYPYDTTQLKFVSSARTCVAIVVRFAAIVATWFHRLSEQFAAGGERSEIGDDIVRLGHADACAARV